MGKIKVKQTYLIAAMIAALGFVSVTLAQGVNIMMYGLLTMSLIALLLAFNLKEMTPKKGEYKKWEEGYVESTRPASW